MRRLLNGVFQPTNSATDFQPEEAENLVPDLDHPPHDPERQHSHNRRSGVSRFATKLVNALDKVWMDRLVEEPRFRTSRDPPPAAAANEWSESVSSYDSDYGSSTCSCSECEREEEDDGAIQTVVIDKIEHLMDIHTREVFAYDVQNPVFIGIMRPDGTLDKVSNSSVPGIAMMSDPRRRGPLLPDPTLQYIREVAPISGLDEEEVNKVFWEAQESLADLPDHITVMPLADGGRVYRNANTGEVTHKHPIHDKYVAYFKARISAQEKLGHGEQVRPSAAASRAMSRVASGAATPTTTGSGHGHHRHSPSHHRRNHSGGGESKGGEGRSDALSVSPRHRRTQSSASATPATKPVQYAEGELISPLPRKKAASVAGGAGGADSPSVVVLKEAAEAEEAGAGEEDTAVGRGELLIPADLASTLQSNGSQGCRGSLGASAPQADSFATSLIRPPPGDAGRRQRPRRQRQQHRRELSFGARLSRGESFTGEAEFSAIGNIDDDVAATAAASSASGSARPPSPFLGPNREKRIANSLNTRRRSRRTLRRRGSSSNGGSSNGGSSNPGSGRGLDDVASPSSGGGGSGSDRGLGGAGSPPPLMLSSPATSPSRSFHAPSSPGGPTSQHPLTVTPVASRPNGGGGYSGSRGGSSSSSLHIQVQERFTAIPGGGSGSSGSGSEPATATATGSPTASPTPPSSLLSATSRPQSPLRMQPSPTAS